MIISKLTEGVYTYFNLHAEQAITSTYIDVQGLGIYEEILTPNTLQRVENEITNNEIIILDFSLIKSCQNNIKQHLSNIKSKSYYVILINIHKQLIENLEISLFNNPNNESYEDYYKIFYLHEDSNKRIDSSLNLEALFEKTFKNKLKFYISIEHNNLHTSSSVYLTSYVDLKKFISLDNAFIIYAIYNLAIKIDKKWISCSSNKKPILICQNLNSAYIVSILSSLLQLNILILDKIGPINKLYSRLGSTIVGSEEYVIVSDLVCLGTEVKIVKNLVEFSGGKYLGNVSLIRTETLKREDKDYDDALSVFTISRENNRELNYYIFTNLEPIINE